MLSIWIYGILQLRAWVTECVRTSTSILVILPFRFPHLPTFLICNSYHWIISFYIKGQYTLNWYFRFWMRVLAKVPLSGMKKIRNTTEWLLYRLIVFIYNNCSISTVLMSKQRDTFGKSLSDMDRIYELFS